MTSKKTPLPFESHWVECECHSPEHLFKISFDPDDGELYMTVHLSNWYPWYKRVWTAVKYAFGYKCKYGNFDELLVDREKREELFQIVKKFKEYHDQ